MGNVCVSVMFIRACVCMPQLNRKLQTAIDDKDRQLEEMQVYSTCDHVWDMSVNAQWRGTYEFVHIHACIRGP